jgi:hypothetical protein
MRLRTCVTWVTLAVFLAAGCGGGKGRQVADPLRDLHALATKLGCTFVEETDGHTLYTSDEGSCGDLTLSLFAGARQRDSWLSIAQGFGGDYLVGSTWVVSADSPAAVKSAQAKVGGQLR